MFKDNAYYFTIGDASTTDKLEAILLCESSGFPINFHIPQFLENFPVHIEPKEDMATLCKRHAHNIRQSYDYVRLWFSGGCDSEYVLNTFIKNNIFIDEIMIMKAGIKEADWEIDDVAIPYINKIQNKIPNTKITIKSATMNDYKDWFKNAYWFERYTSMGRSSRCFHYLRINEALESITMHNTTSNTINIRGGEKSHIMHIDNKWYAYFLDLLNDTQEGNSTNHLTNFFWDDPLIFTKQCHLTKKAIETNLPKNLYNTVCFGKQNQELWNASIERVTPGQKFIKKSWNYEFPGIVANSQKEAIGQNVFRDLQPSLYKKYIEGIQHLNSIGNGKYFNNGNALKGSVGIFGPFLCIDKKETKTIDQLFPNGFKL